jgi:sulfopyruvate decarboxylase TPP-binding subunit
MNASSWSKHVADVLRRNGVRTFATVPDSILGQVLEHLRVDSDCRVVTVQREEEGVGILSGRGLPVGWAPSSCRTAGSATVSTRWLR